MNFIESATTWRESNYGNGESYVGKGGVVVFHKTQVQGWVNELRNPEEWEPGCIAINEDGDMFMTVGGNAQTGAESWCKLGTEMACTISELHDTSNKKTLNHLMLDIETLGTAPDAVVISIGAVFFEPSTGETGNRFYRNISLESCIKAGLTVDASTIAWWMNQGEEAKALFNSQEYVSIERGLKSLAEFINRNAQNPNTMNVWGNGPSFDNTIISNLYRKFEMPRPWAYYNERCVRTIVEIGLRRGHNPKKTIPFTGTKHNALDDATHQAAYVSEIYRSLNV